MTRTANYPPAEYPDYSDPVPMTHAKQWVRTANAKTAVVVVSTVLWLTVVLIWTGTAGGLAAGLGGGGRFGSRGAEEGYNGQGKGGGGGKGGDPVPLSTDDSPDPMAGGEVATGDETVPESGTAISDLNRRKSDVGTGVLNFPTGRKNSGNATPDTGAGSGNEGTEFFGVRSTGRHFVYVVDNSSSMSGDKFVRAVDELLRSISKLKKNHKFYVIFFNSVTVCQFNDAGPPSQLIPASPTNKRKLNEWIASSIQPEGGTAPEQALTWALGIEPNVIYFLTDGQFDPQVVTRITAANARSKIQIHTIAFGGDADGALLKQMADKNRGQFKAQP